VIDRHNRWCLFYDLELKSSPNDGPVYQLAEQVAPLLDRVLAGVSSKSIDRDTRRVRIAAAERIDVAGSPCLALVFTLGNQNAADPSFLDLTLGTARDATRGENEVKGVGAHCVIRLTPTPEHPRRHLVMLEQTAGIGRTIVERLLNSELAEIALARGDNFVSAVSGRAIKVRPIAHMSGHKSDQLEEALRTGTFAPIELIDTTPDANFDEPGKFRAKRRVMRIELVAPPGERREVLERISAKAREAGYQRMRINWRPTGATRPNESEIATDLADLSEALFTKRELIHIEAGMSECSHTLRQDFIAAMVEKFA
jgi:hypothetical protein